MPKTLRDIVSYIVVATGLNSLCGFFLRRKIYVLPYHSIVGAPGAFDDLKGHISFSAEEFEKHIAFLKSHGHAFMRMSDAADAVRKGLKGVDKPTAIYFDDGHKDNYSVALPILEKYDIPATLFVTTGFIDGTDMPWTMEYRSFLKSRKIAQGEWEKRIHGFKTLSDAERKAAVEKEYEAAGFIPAKEIRSLFLSWEEIKKLQGRGWEIGSHGVSHVRLSECADDALDAELARSKARIEEKLGCNVSSISFPHGRFDRRVKSSVIKNGYTAAVSIGHGLNSARTDNGATAFFRNVPVRAGDSLATFKANLYFWNLFRPS